MKNEFAGRCRVCGQTVAADQGERVRISGQRVTQHVECGAQAVAATRARQAATAVMPRCTGCRQIARAGRTMCTRCDDALEESNRELTLRQAAEAVLDAWGESLDLTPAIDDLRGAFYR